MPRFDPKLMLLMKASMISTTITLVLLFAVCIYYERTKAELREHQKAARRGQTRRQIMIEHMVSWARAKKRSNLWESGPSNRATDDVKVGSENGKVLVLCLGKAPRKVIPQHLTITQKLEGGYNWELWRDTKSISFARVVPMLFFADHLTLDP